MYLADILIFNFANPFQHLWSNLLSKSLQISLSFLRNMLRS